MGSASLHLLPDLVLRASGGCCCLAQVGFPTQNSISVCQGCLVFVQTLIFGYEWEKCAGGSGCDGHVHLLGARAVCGTHSLCFVLR